MHLFRYEGLKVEVEDPCRCEISVLLPQYTNGMKKHCSRYHYPQRQCKHLATRFFRGGSYLSDGSFNQWFVVRLCGYHCNSNAVDNPPPTRALKFIEITKAEYESERDRSKQGPAKAVSAGATEQPGA